MAQSMAHCAKNGALMSSERPVGCETEFFQPSESAGKNLMAAGKNKKNPVIFSAIQCDSVRFGQIFQKPRHSIPGTFIFLSLVGLGPPKWPRPRFWRKKPKLRLASISFD
jgi:hypothetical protein